MVGLCEIAGLFARTIWHLTCEVYVENHWAYIDPQFGLFYLDKDGKMLSVEEIVADPDVILNQPDWVYACGSDEYTPKFMQQQNYDLYFSKREIQLYSKYSLADAHKYHFDWRPSAAFPVPARDAAYKEYSKAQRGYLEDKELYRDGVTV